MDNYFERIASEIRKRDNKTYMGIVTGEIISYEPVTIRVYHAGEPLTFSKFFSIKGLMNNGSGVTEGDLYVTEYPYDIGDKYICMMGSDNQSLWILGKYECISDLNIYEEAE